MLISQIITKKAIQETITVAPTATISEAAELLSTHKIGAIIVATSPTQVEGILSERDIVRELGRVGSGCLDKLVGDLMTKKLITCPADNTALSVLETMSTGRFRHMPVMDGKTMIGLVSIGDVVKARLEQLAMENSAMETMIAGA